MEKKHIALKEDELVDYILKNFQENALLEISYNRVFVPGKILNIDEDAVITLQLKGKIMNQRVDIGFDEIKEELVEIIYTLGEQVTVITITD